MKQTAAERIPLQPMSSNKRKSAALCGPAAQSPGSLELKSACGIAGGGGGAAGAEFRQLQSSQGIVSAWAPAAPELDADETLSPKPSCIGLGLEQALHSPLSPHFPQQQTPYWTLPLPFTSFRPLELF